jgi:hypothetical protein
VFGSSLPLGPGQTKKINGFLCMIPDTHNNKINPIRFATGLSQLLLNKQS